MSEFNSRRRKRFLPEKESTMWKKARGNVLPGLEFSSLSKIPLRPVYHYPSTYPFPVVLDDAFPCEPYRSRHNDIKTSIHWGQRKLLLSEIQLLTLYCKPDVPYHIVYVGAAPGTHLGFLDDIFAKRHTWELIDPGNFDLPVLVPRKNFCLRNEFFTNATAYEINARRLTEVLPALGALYRFLTNDNAAAGSNGIHEELRSGIGTADVARRTEVIPSMYEPPLCLPHGLELLCFAGMERAKPLLFISDIRSGNVNFPNFQEHVAENMRAQEAWTRILHGAYSMLKFRLPYTRTAKTFGGRDEVVETKLIHSDGTVPYLRGDILLPIWTRPTSTEGRLVVPQGAFQKRYNVAHIENQFFFFNARVREQVHFNHLGTCSALDHHFDAAAEVECLQTYLKFMFPHLREVSAQALGDKVARLSESITKHLGITFKDAIRRRDTIITRQARCNSTGSGVRPPSVSDAVMKEASPLLEGLIGSGANNGRGVKSKDPSDTPLDGGATHHKVPSNIAEDVLSREWETFVLQMIHLAARERKRACWWRNVDESILCEPSGFWVTHLMGAE